MSSWTTLYSIAAPLGEMIQAIVGLGRVTTSPLKGRAQNWRTALVVTDPAGETVVKVAFGKLARPAYAVADGETLSWKLSGLLRKRCRIGPDLWAARPRGLRYGRFQADLSGVLLARQDLSLLAGLFSVLSYRSFQEQGSGFAAIPFGI